jgi:tetraacyldisaccharide 4'-kinase
MMTLESFWQRHARYLLPLGTAYDMAMRIRSTSYACGVLSSRRSPLPVVSVGNLTLGGSGKTPLTMWLAEKLVEKGFRPGIVSRGYARKTHPHEVVIVSDGHTLRAQPHEAGDEPYMMAYYLPHIPIAVCKDRLRAIETLAQATHIDCVILDDGFQHLRLSRDFDLVIVDSRVMREHVFPAGYLRESPKALARASAFAVVLDEDQDGDTFLSWIRSRWPKIPSFPMHFSPAYLEDLGTHSRMPLSSLQGKRVFAFAGIANPERFFRSLTELGSSVVPCPLPDHYHYDDAAVSAFVSQARRFHCDALVTTAKDAVKLLPYAPTKELPLWVLHQTVEIDCSDHLLDAICHALRTRPTES